MLFILSVVALGSETCLDPFTASMSAELPSGRLVLDRGVLTAADEVIGIDVLWVSPVAEKRVAFVQRRQDSALTDLVVWDATDGATRVLIEAGTPAQPVLSPDGSTVAFVDGWTGITSVYTMPFAGGPPVQRTNVGLVRVPGQAPQGFVPSPSRGFLTTEGALTWTEDGATHVLPWRGGAL